MWHYSPPNRSEKNRSAIAGVIKMRNYFINAKKYIRCLSRRSSIGFLAIVVGASFFLACDNAERTTQIITPPEEGAEQLPSGEGLDIGERAPDFSLPDSEGNTHNLSQYIGQTLVIVFYRTGT